MEYKFRGKRLDNGKWVHGFYVEGASNGSNRILEHGIAEYGSYPVEVDPETVGQYTGRKDKNGVEVYGGDILSRDRYWPRVVEHYRVYPLDKVQRLNSNGIPIDEFDFDLWHVTGNIHDNNAGDSK